MMMLAHSCTKNQIIPEPEPDAPNIVLSLEKIEAPAEGGEYTVNYTLKNPVEGETLQISEVPEWMSADRNTESSISITVSENKETSIREADIKISYESVEVTLYVTQDGVPYFDVEFTDIKESHITYNATPADEDMTYISFYTEVLYYINDEIYLKTMIDSFKESAKQWGIPLKDYMDQLIRTGQQDNITLNNLVPGINYFINYIGYDNKTGEFTTPLYKFATKTKSIEYVNETLQLNAEINGSFVDLHVIPSDTELYYITHSFKTNDIINPEELLILYQLEIYDKIKYYQSISPGLSVEDIIEFISNKGEKTIGFENFKVNSKYGIAVFYVDTKTGYITMFPQTIEITTEDFKKSDNTFKVELIEITDNSAMANVITSNNDPYKLGYISGDYFPGMTEEEIAEELLSGRFTLPIDTKRGNYLLDMIWLTPNTDWYIFAYGWAEGEGKCTTEVFLTKFTTRAPQLADCSLELECDKYFDGDALLEAYPGMFDGLDIAGKVVFPVKATPTGDYDAFYYMLLDYDTRDRFSDSSLNSRLTKPEYGISEPTTYFICTYEIPYGELSRSLIGNSFDKDGKPGTITRIEGIVFTKEGASPASEFVPFDAGTKTITSFKEKMPIDRSHESLMATLKK